MESEKLTIGKLIEKEVGQRKNLRDLLFRHKF